MNDQYQIQIKGTKIFAVCIHLQNSVYYHYSTARYRRGRSAVYAARRVADDKTTAAEVWAPPGWERPEQLSTERHCRRGATQCAKAAAVMQFRSRSPAAAVVAPYVIEIRSCSKKNMTKTYFSKTKFDLLNFLLS